jgi:hypothetical protein
VIEDAGVAAISNCIEYTVEIPAPRGFTNPAKSSFFLLHRAIFDGRVPEWEENREAGIGDVPVEA